MNWIGWPHPRRGHSDHSQPSHRPPGSPVKAIFKNHDRNHSKNQKARAGLAGGLIDDSALQENRGSGAVSLKSSPGSPPVH